VRRQFRLTAWYTGDELAKIRDTAAAAGMTPAAWLAKLGTDAAEAGAGGRAENAAAGASDVIAAMSHATNLARRLGYLFNQPLADLHSTGEHSPALRPPPRPWPARCAGWSPRRCGPPGRCDDRPGPAPRPDRAGNRGSA
jgi:hypothetical protein